MISKSSYIGINVKKLINLDKERLMDYKKAFVLAFSPVKPQRTHSLYSIILILGFIKMELQKYNIHGINICCDMIENIILELSVSQLNCLGEDE